LCLWGNGLNNAAIPFLIEYLSKNPFLQVLYLNGNDIGEEGAEQVAQAVVKYNTRLLKLDLSKNPCHVPKSLQEKLISNRNTYVKNLFFAEKCKDRIMEALGIETDKEVNYSPDRFETISEITYLDLSFSQLDSIPTRIGEFCNIQTLKLSYNKLTSLPKTIKQLSQLEILDLRGNLFEEFPEFLTQHFPNLIVKI